MEWLNRERLTFYAYLIVAIYVVLGVVGFLAPGILGHLDFMSHPQGARRSIDFSNFWLAASMTLDGKSVYDAPGFIAAEEKVFGIKVFPWFYPPTFLLILLPLAFLPYFMALMVWVAATLTGYLWAVRRIAPHPLATWLALAFPGAFENFRYGQNGFLSAALIGGGLLLLDSSPIIAGILIGMLSYKPHLMILIAVALAAGRRWKALGAAAASAAALALTSLLILGQPAWAAFFQNAPSIMKLVEEGALPFDKMVTVFSALYSSGAGFQVALWVHFAVMLLVMAAVFLVWRQGRPLAVRASVLVIGILLFTPYAFSYDLCILAMPLAWLGWQGYQKGWLPGEQALLALGWSLPFLGLILAVPPLAKVKYLRLLPPVILGALIILAITRRKGESVRLRPV
jgi:hypothetical protein